MHRSYSLLCPSQTLKKFFWEKKNIKTQPKKALCQQIKSFLGEKICLSMLHVWPVISLVTRHNHFRMSHHFVYQDIGHVSSEWFLYSVCNLVRSFDHAHLTDESGGSRTEQFTVLLSWWQQQKVHTQLKLPRRMLLSVTVPRQSNLLCTSWFSWIKGFKKSRKTPRGKVGIHFQMWGVEKKQMRWRQHIPSRSA